MIYGMPIGEKQIITSKPGEPIEIIHQTDVFFEHPRPDVHMAVLPIAGCGWVDTDEGVVLVDTLMNKPAAATTLNKIHELGGHIRYIIYTHGHLDHVSGTDVFLADQPKEIIASSYLPDRLDKYKALLEHTTRISAMQFNLPEVRTRNTNWIYPTKTFLEEYTFSLGGKTFELHATRAETDDACWVWVPEIRTAFIGDLIIGSFPNIGNPFKPTRFALDWVRALKEVRAKGPELVLCSGAGAGYEGKEALEILDVNIEVIQSLHDQIVEFINQDMHITEMIHAIRMPEHLSESKYVKFYYSKPEFFVFNVYRWYHGYFDHNPANLLPRPQQEIAAEIFDLVGNSEKILRRVQHLMDKGQTQLGLQVLDVLLQVQPEHIEARKLRLQMLEELGAEDDCLISRNTYLFFAKKDRNFIRENSEP